MARGDKNTFCVCFTWSLFQAVKALSVSSWKLYAGWPDDPSGTSVRMKCLLRTFAKHAFRYTCERFSSSLRTETLPEIFFNCWFIFLSAAGSMHAKLRGCSHCVPFAQCFSRLKSFSGEKASAKVSGKAKTFFLQRNQINYFLFPKPIEVECNFTC